MNTKKLFGLMLAAAAAVLLFCAPIVAVPGMLLGMAFVAAPAPGVPFRSKTFVIPAQLTATTNPVFRFTAIEDMVPRSCRVTPLTEFDRTTGDETYVLSIEVDGTKVSTDNDAVTTAAKAATIEATFASGTKIAKGSVVEIILTLGGTTPIVPAYSVVELDYVPVHSS